MANDKMIQGTPGIADSYTAMVPAGAWDGNKLDLNNVATSVRGWLMQQIAKLANKKMADVDEAIAKANAADLWAVLADSIPMPPDDRLNHNLPDSYALQHDAAQRFELPWPGFVS